MRMCVYVYVYGCAVIATASLAACNPTFNWRDVRLDDTRLSLLMPCKPDKAQKTVPLGGQPTELLLLSCDAGGVTFALAVADVKDDAKTTATLNTWQSATLANIKAAPNSSSSAVKLTGLASGAVVTQANGQRTNGQPVASQAAYFAQGSQVFQAVMYADKISPDVADTFFSSLKFE